MRNQREFQIKLFILISTLLIFINSKHHLSYRAQIYKAYYNPDYYVVVFAGSGHEACQKLIRNLSRGEFISIGNTHEYLTALRCYRLRCKMRGQELRHLYYPQLKRYIQIQNDKFDIYPSDYVHIYRTSIYKHNILVALKERLI